MDGGRAADGGFAGRRGRSLDGTWRAMTADEELRRTYPNPDFEDDGWEDLAVPGHWRSSPAFAGSDGPLLMRRRFELQASAPTSEDWPAESRHWLVLEGVFYTSDVWLDGSYLGDTEGYFFPHTFEVTAELAARSEHVLAMEVACTPQRDRTRKRNLTGVFQHWDLIDQDWNPGGIWRPVRIETSGPVRIRHHRILCRDARQDAAAVFVRTVLDALRSDLITIRTRVTDPHGREAVELVREQPVAAGENRLEWTVTVPDPMLWWPWSLGEQPLYTVEVEVLVGDERSDHIRRTVGMRRVALRNWIFSINGERLFLKGTNQGPNRIALAEASAELFADDVARVREAGLDLLRVHGHISRPELYRAADEQGVLLWQDLPLQWGYARSVRRQARRQAREAVDLLGHHASIVVWCGHNEPMAIDVEPSAVADPRRRARIAARAVAAQVLPTWNRSVLDHSISSVLTKSDGSRPVVPHSGVFPHPPQLDGTDTHLYLGWYMGDARSFPRLLRWWPRLARFVTEFGAQAVPTDAAFLEPDRWPDLDWDRAWRVHALQKPFFDRYVPPAAHPTFDDWREATQRYQAELIKLHIETLRRLKYRPTGGFAQFCFTDGYPSVTWSVLDHDRHPKAGFHALVAACRPLIVVADLPPRSMQPGEPLRARVHVVSDLRIALTDLVVHAQLEWRDRNGVPTSLSWRWQGEVAADACSFVGTIDTVVPVTEGELALRLELVDPDSPASVLATNRYTTTVVATPAGAEPRTG
ncbi:MAG: hypothetical protein WHS89_12990 [Acidimicrobiales bacterium]